MKKIILFIFFNCASSIMNSALSQNPLVKMWDKRFGGMDYDGLYSFQQTNNGGYILGGPSGSGTGGDKTQINQGNGDYWIVKIDAYGTKQWDKDFGGPDVDYLYSLQQTTDGGYVLGGISLSGIGGDKTQSSWGVYDIWIVKTDSAGNKLWDKRFGGTNIDALNSIQQTSDGGYILGGTSDSPISGDKTEPSWGSYDYWIVKIDSTGNKLWDKRFGGIDNDALTSIEQTSDGGYILGGTSHSRISGDKTQDLWGSFGYSDYWIVKTDSIGNKEWDIDLGGSDFDELYSLQQTIDGGFILGGFSRSQISGNKTQPTWGGAFDSDYWIVKTDSVGNKEWDKDFGGAANEDEFGSITQTTDNGYLISGTSYSNISGSKTENNLGNEQTWVLKIDSIGNKQWDKTLHTNTSTDDEIGLGIESNDGCFVFANYTDGGIAGDKSQPSWSSWDFWIVKFCDSTLTPVAAFASPYQICPGTCTYFLNNSTNATSYLWSFPGASPDTSTDLNPTNVCYATPGTYDVQLIASNPASGGSDTLLLTNYITVYPFPPPQSITQNGDTLFAITGSASYQWYFNTNLISGATDYFYVAQASGDYNVVATDANGCEVEAAVFNVVAGIPSTVDRIQWTIFPNPVEDKFTMQNAQCMMRTANEISVYNVLGEMVLTVQPHTSGFIPITIGTETSIDVSELTPGLYYIEIVEGEKIFRNKFMKE